MELPDPEPPRPTRMGLITALYGALALVAVLVSAGRDRLDIYRVAEISTPTLLVLSPLIGVAVGLVVVALSRLAVHRFALVRALHRDFRGLLGELTPREILALAAASAIGEELLFRGALLPWIGLWPQAILFALLHIGPRLRFFAWTLAAFVMGLVFGALLLWVGDLGAAITAHFTINYLNLHFIARVELPPEPAVGDASPR